MPNKYTRLDHPWKLAADWYMIKAMRPKAFTLIELLITIAIIGILIATSAYAWSSASARGRDSTRKNDLARLKQVLTQFYSDTRSYPSFQTTGGTIFSASWQLSSNGTTGCSHSNNKALTSKYINEIPQDPKDKTKYSDTTVSCSTLAGSQANRYYYISGPTEATGPTSPARSFGLMVLLERPNSTDLLDVRFNPLVADGTQFGPWYNGRNPESFGVTGNYLLTQQTQ